MMAHPHVILIISFLVCTTPFIAKPFHLDDPMYLWAAEQILRHPADFYGFDVIWSYSRQPMSEIMQNPPLASYLIALAALVFGMNEVALHAVFLLPALGLVLGTHRLAQGMCRQPLLAALITLVTPVFVISSLTIMCDILMVCFWVWAVALWRDGLKCRRPLFLAIAAAFCGLSALAKYPGMCVIPLLAAYTLVQSGRARLNVLWLLIPLAMLLLFELYTNHMYQTGLLAGAAKHAAQARVITRARPEVKLLVGLCFVGGCLAPALFLWPWLWSWRAIAVWIGMAMILYLAADALLPHRMKISDAEYEAGVEQFVQVAIWAATGFSIMTLAAIDLWQRRGRDTDSLLLLMWIAGTFVFACFINWSINGRSLLPMAPAVGILLVRRLELRRARVPSLKWPWLGAPIAVSAALAMALTWSDMALAISARTAARTIAAEFGGRSETLWFQGHWGFQQYMKDLGGTIMDFNTTRLPPHDFLIVPRNNVNCRPIGHPYSSVVKTMEFPTSPLFSTMNMATGAGFYSDSWGPLPFAVRSAPEHYQVLRMNFGLEPITAEEAAALNQPGAAR